MARIRMDFRVEGLDEVLRQFNRFDREARVNFREAVKKTATNITRMAKARVPVGDSGLLKKSIRAAYDRDGFGAEIGAGNKKAYYAGFVEHGTTKMTARPYMHPSGEEAKPQYIADVTRAITRALP